jgi:hypothetical protein
MLLTEVDLMRYRKGTEGQRKSRRDTRVVLACQCKPTSCSQKEGTATTAEGAMHIKLALRRMKKERVKHLLVGR